MSDGAKQGLPRFYKDRIFVTEAVNEDGELMKVKMKRALEVHAQESIEIADANYWKELERLSKLHPEDVFRHMEERIRSAHESTRLKENKQDKF